MNTHHTRRTIALVVGDTAGHAYPALAVAHAFRDADPDTRIMFIGTADSVAAGIVARERERFEAVPGAPLRRVGVSGRLRAAFITVRAVGTARALLRRERVDLAIGFGGFASGGVLVAARTLRIMTAIHEANVEPGLANMLLSRLVDRVYLAHADTALRRGTPVGVPVRPSIARLSALEREPPSGTLRVLVTSGSRGADALAHAVSGALGRVRQAGVKVALLQQISDDAAPAVKQQYADLGIDATCAPLLDMRDAYAWAHVAIARAGASTLAELSAAGLPAAVFPLADAAANHQEANARRWAAAGGGPMLLEAALPIDDLAGWLTEMAGTHGAWGAARDRARTFAPAGAAGRLVDDVRQFGRER